MSRPNRMLALAGGCGGAVFSIGAAFAPLPLPWWGDLLILLITPLIGLLVVAYAYKIMQAADRKLEHMDHLKLIEALAPKPDGERAIVTNNTRDTVDAGRGIGEKTGRVSRRERRSARLTDARPPTGWRIAVLAACMAPAARRRWLDLITETLYDFEPAQHPALLRDFRRTAPRVIMRSWTVDFTRSGASR